MGQGHWIRQSDGHYKHYTEEEYDNMMNEGCKYILIGFVILSILGLIIGVFEWMAEKKMMWLPLALGIIGVIIYCFVKRKGKRKSNRRHPPTSGRRNTTTIEDDF